MTPKLQVRSSVSRKAATGLFLFVAAFLTARPLWAQVATGIPPFASMAPSSFDMVNEANGNVFFTIPMVNKAGRGMPFTYALAFNNSIWTPWNASGYHVWTPAGSWGWAGVSSASMGYVSYSWQQGWCYDPDSTQDYYWDITTYNSYVNPTGAWHSLNGTVVSGWDPSWPCGSGPPDSATINVNDGSGYTVIVSAYPGYNPTIYPRSGISISPYIINQNGSGIVTDTNGNQLKVNQTSGTFTYTDTLNATAMTASGNAVSNTYTYTDPNGNAASYTVWYSQFTVQTNFGCSGVTEYGPSTQYLPTYLTLPDGTAYDFYYAEQTPNNPSAITGRLTALRLPTGGYIRYSYSGGSNGVTCIDGSTPTLTRTLDPTGTGSPEEIWTYSHTASWTSWTATITDPAGNETDLNFVYGPYETERKVYQGPSSGGNLLATIDTCYNGSAVPCLSTAVNIPISSRTAKTTVPNPSSPSQVHTAYNGSGLPTEVDEYNFGASTPTRKTVMAYASLSNSYINDRLSDLKVEDGASNLAAHSSYGYDGNGNLTSESHDTGGTPASIGRSFTYGSYGVLASATDFHGNSTSYSAPECSSAFPSTITLPNSLSSSIYWNCNSGVPTGCKVSTVARRASLMTAGCGLWSQATRTKGPLPLPIPARTRRTSTPRS